jgi:hypothetical protein
LHCGRPCFVDNQLRSLLFQDGFVAREKWFRPPLGGLDLMTIFCLTCMLPGLAEMIRSCWKQS